MLLDTLTPNLYRENAFLITGLAVDVEDREIRRYRNRRHASGELTDEIEAALEVLRDPGLRLVHELFTFWRTDRDEPPAGVPPELCAAHDQAVEAHRAALELELDGGEPTPRDAWRRAVTLWASLLDQQAVWDRLRHRVAALDDPRLTDVDVERLRARFPDLLLDVNAQLAAENPDPARQRALMRKFASQGGLEAQRVEAALERASAGVLARVGKACDEAQDEAADELGPAALDRLDANVVPDIAWLLRVLGEQHPAAVRTRDHAAQTYRLCAVRFVKARGKGAVDAVIPGMCTALDLAATPTVARRISKDLEAMQLSVGFAVSVMTLGAIALATGLWWAEGWPWGMIPGAVILLPAVETLHAALRLRPAAQGWTGLGIGTATVIIGSLPWGGLWLGDGTGLWAIGHVGTWLVGFGHVYVVYGAMRLGLALRRERELTTTLAGASGLSMGALWLLGGGGWPAFLGSIMLFLVTASALGSDHREVSPQLLTRGALLVTACVVIVTGFGSIGVLPTVLIAVVMIASLRSG